MLQLANGVGSSDSFLIFFNVLSLSFVYEKISPRELVPKECGCSQLSRVVAETINLFFGQSFDSLTLIFLFYFISTQFLFISFFPITQPIKSIVFLSLLHFSLDVSGKLESQNRYKCLFLRWPLHICWNLIEVVTTQVMNGITINTLAY